MASGKIVRPTWPSPFLNIVETPDGSVFRPPFPSAPADADPAGSSPVLSKDVALDPIKKTWQRIYIPRSAINSSSPPSKLPVIVYYHGGGFIFCNADNLFFDGFCKGLAEKVGAVVISLDHRLAPENRLPAAYDDAMDGLNWIKNTDDEWVNDYADLNRVYLCGTSAGGNIAYNLGLRVAPLAKEFEPLKIKGLILHHAYFRGTKRTPSEEKLANDSLLPLHAIIQMFDLSLPKGVDHDHEYSNPLSNGGSKHIEDMKALGWGVLVSGCFGDPLVDANIEFGKMLEEKGIRTVKLFIDGYHGMEAFDPSTSKPFFDLTKEFISSN